jgi:hypothetical protein
MCMFINEQKKTPIKMILKWFLLWDLWALFIGLAYYGKDIVFRFIIEYSSLRDFIGP